MRGQKNANFFKQGGGNDMGGGDIIIAAPSRKPEGNQNSAMAAGAGQTGGPPSKSLEKALKRAQQSGTLSL